MTKTHDKMTKMLTKIKMIKENIKKKKWFKILIKTSISLILK